ncbi:MAG TPA: SDR family oxidoreductase [Miltoncostaeaceae bacterium]|nr:SDR family oxidoreductase [Miltoncostaeaceae bacterium]
MDLGIAGRRAAVAAASAGLGLGAARALTDAGVRVAICGRDRDRLAGAAGSLGDGAVAISADLSDAARAGAFVGEAAERLGGPVDILVANAGGPPPGSFATTGMDAYRAALEVNCLSTIAMCRVAVPGMRERGWGRVVAITSLGARQPLGDLIASSTARAAVTAFLKVLALEVAGDGVTVNSVQPGTHLTARVAALPGAAVEERAAAIPAGRLGDADDFGAVVAFLCSEQAGFVTGVGLPVDGGAHRGLQ